MRIDVEVFGTLRGKLPGDDGRGKGSYDVMDGASIRDAFGQLAIPPEIRYIIMVNGKQESDRERVLQDGDKLTVLPPVAGGADSP